MIEPQATGAGAGRLAAPLDLMLCGLLALAVLAVFAPVLGHGFVSYDDTLYVTENAHVKAGLTRAGLAWALSAREASNWHPLTWLSHMLDCQVYGLRAWGHHLTSVLLHALNAVLVFVLLARMTAARWPSAFSAALFALHPLHVESVAWIAERKDVLSTLLFLLALGAYLRYARRPSLGRYLVVCASFALGLAAKPMLVTFPFVLLLLDVWPLQRLGRHTYRATGNGTMRPRRNVAPAGPESEAGDSSAVPIHRLRRRPCPAPGPSSRTSFSALLGAAGAPGRSWSRLILEKVPLLALAAASAALTLSAQTALPLEKLPLAARLAHALTAYAAYIGKALWPARLAVLYPHPGAPPAWKVAGSAALLGLITVCVLREHRRRPYLACGWLWYLGSLVPVIGLVQVGSQAMADRYSYVPLIGLFIMAAWGGAEIAARADKGRPPARGGLGASRAASEPYRGRDETRCGEGADLGVAVAGQSGPYARGADVGGGDQSEGGQPVFEARGVRIREAWWRSLRVMGGGKAVATAGALVVAVCAVLAWRQTQYWKSNLTLFARAVAVTEDNPVAQTALGNALNVAGRGSEAMVHYVEALRIRPDYDLAHYDLGKSLVEQGDLDAALAHLAETLRLNPGYTDAHVLMGFVLYRKGRVEEAIAHYRDCLRLKPDAALALNNLAWIRATNDDARFRSGAEAVALARKACALSARGNMRFLATLAAAYAEAGQFSDALGTIDEAIGRARAAGLEGAVREYQGQRALYRESHPLRPRQAAQ